MNNILSYIDSKKDEMLDLLQTLVNIDSGSEYKIGVNRVGKILADELKKEDFRIDQIDQEQYGDLILATKEGKEKTKILLLAHMDTIFPEGTAKKRPFNIKEGRAYGPGVNDMKSGLVSLLFALKSLSLCHNPDSFSINVLLNSNEEVGSPRSRTIIEKEAKKVNAVFVIEPAQPSGEVVTSRKGIGIFELNITGRAAHAGNNPSDGISAIEELAHKIIELHKLNDLSSGITLNVGVVRGGTTRNVVAEEAFADIDLRVKTREQSDEMLKKIYKITSKSVLPGIKISLTGGINRPPMIKTPNSQLLYSLVKESGKVIGMNLKEKFAGGGSDGNFTSALGIPTIDGMGPVGGFSHSDKEYLEIETLTQRCKLLTLSLIKASSK